MRLVSILFLVLAGPVAAQCPVSEFSADDGDRWDRFGGTMAAKGGVVAVGAPGDDDLGTQAGAVYVYHREGRNWFLDAKLTASDGGDYDGFGGALAFDGMRIVVGAIGGGVTGAVYVFELQGGQWTETAILRASDPTVLSRFGDAVAIDGERIAVGAFAHPGGGFNDGAVYVFDRVFGTTVWTETARIFGAAGGFFGRAVAFSAGELVVGADWEDGSAPNSGAVHVFSDASGGWVEVATLVPSDGTPNQAFGRRLAADGTTIAVGAPNDDDAGSLSGSVTIYTRLPGPGTGFGEIASLVAGGTLAAAGSQFGDALAFDGTTLVVGAPLESQTDIFAGAAFVFTRSFFAGWAQVARLEPPDATANDAYGASVAIDGTLVFGGARGDHATATQSGSAYAHDLAGALCGSLDVLPQSVSLGAGGAQTLTIAAGAAAASQVYLVVGSASGTSPGTALGALRAPLVSDAYTQATIAQAGTGPFVGTVGVLDAGGAASATITVPAGADPSLAGVVLAHAVFTFDPVTGALQDVSNRTLLRLRV